MKYRLTRITLFFIAIISSGRLVAQNTDTAGHQKARIGSSSFRTWSVGVSGGISTPYMLIGNNSKQDFTSPDMQLGYAVYFKDQLTNSFGIQADLMMGKLRADHAIGLNSSNVPVYSQFDTKLNWSASLSGNLIIVHLGSLQPYLTAGGGIVSYSPVLHSYYAADVLADQGTLSSFFVPIGLGLKINVARGINLDIGYQVNFVMADNLDGYKYPSNNDKFSYTHIGLEFALGKRSKPQLAAQKKGKMVRDKKFTPEQSSVAPVQTPQTLVDSEKIRDDQVKRELDSTNARLASLTMDSDRDGVPDVKDKCPNTPANTRVDTSGCPLVISVVEVKQPVAEVKQPVIVTDEDKRIINVAAKGVEFYTGTEIISSRAFPNLNSVVKLLTAKNLSVKINGYTNKAHSSTKDLALAKLRAEAVKNYLVNRGATESAIAVEGHNGFAPGANLAGRRKQPNAGMIQISIVQ